MFSPTQMGQIYLIFNQLPFLWDTSEIMIMINWRNINDGYITEGNIQSLKIMANI